MGMGTMCVCPYRGQSDSECSVSVCAWVCGCVCVCSVHLCGRAPLHLSACASISVSTVCDSTLFALVCGLRVGICLRWQLVLVGVLFM